MKHGWTRKLLAAGVACAGLISMAGPAQAAESTANTYASMWITSGPNYVVAGYRPTFTANIAITKSHRIDGATLGGDCSGNYGRLYAKTTYVLSCRTTTAISDSNPRFDMTLSGTGKTWPYWGSGKSTSLTVNRDIEVLHPSLSVDITAPTGTTFDGESGPYVYLQAQVKATNTGDVGLRSVSLGANVSCPSLPTTLAAGQSATVLCTFAHNTNWDSLQMTANVSGTPDVPAYEVYPSTYTASASDTITYTDDLDLTVVTMGSLTR